MRELDGDKERIVNSSDEPACRDIVQFVPMQDFIDRDFHALAREVRVLVVPMDALSSFCVSTVSAPCTSQK